MKEEVFDKLLRDKMSKDSLLNNEGLDWSAFSEQLDSIPELNPQLDPFDKMIQGALGGAITQDTKGMDWGSFAEKLNEIPELDVNNVDFDQALIDKVDKINYTYQPKDWENLSQRLDTEGLLNNHIISIKSLELLVFIFLIWGFQNFSNQENLPHNFIPTMPSPDEVKENTTNRSDVIYSYEDSNKNTNDESLLKNATDQLTTDLTKPNYNQYSLPIINDSQIVVSAEKTNIDNNLINNNILDLEKGLTGITNVFIPVTSSLPSLGAIVISSQKNDLLAINKVSLDNVNTTLKTTKDIKIHGTPKSNRRFSVGLNGLAKVNYIHSTSEAYSSNAGGYVDEEFSDVVISKGAALSFNWDNGNTALSTGIEYSSFDFINNPNVHIDTNKSGSTSNGDIYADKVNKIEMKMLSIPVSLKYKLKALNKWRPYVKGGMAVHFNVKQIVNKTETFNFQQEDEYLLEGARVSNSYNIFDEDTNLPSYTYVSVNFGVGLERNINSNLSFYIEPSFELNTKSKSLKVKGSRINAFGLRAGLSYYL